MTPSPSPTTTPHHHGSCRSQCRAPRPHGRHVGALYNASALAVVTATDDAGVVQFRSNTILQADDWRLSDVPTGRLLALLLEVCDNAVPGRGTNEKLDLFTAMLAASKGGGSDTLQNLRKRSTIVGRAFGFLVVSTTLSGTPRSDMRRAVVGDSTYLLLPSRRQLAPPPPAASPSTAAPAAIPLTPTPAVIPPQSTSALSKHGRGSDDDTETTGTGDGGTSNNHAPGLRTDFDVPKQLS